MCQSSHLLASVFSTAAGPLLPFPGRELQNIETRCEELRRIIDRQELSVTDVERMMQERNLLRTTLRKATDALSAVQKEVWDLEMRLAQEQGEPGGLRMLRCWALATAPCRCNRRQPQGGCGRLQRGRP